MQPGANITGGLSAVGEGQDIGGLASRAAFEERRRKTWDELTSDERIERLRECLRDKDMAIQDLREQVGRLMNHSHGRNGELLGPLYGRGNLEAAAYRRYNPLA